MTRVCALISLASALLVHAGCRRSESIAPFSNDRIELRHVNDGETLFLVDDGNVYREIETGKSWEYVATVFDPDEVKRSYVTEEGITFRIAPETSKRYKTRQDWNESFDDLLVGQAGLVQLVKEDRELWGSFTLQSPQAPTVPEYVALRSRIMQGESGFLDARVEPSSERAHSGPMSLKCVSPANPSSMVTCKASISSPLVYFRNGDDFWLEAYYYVENHLPLTLVDLESEFVDQHPGIRLRIYQDGCLGVELKAIDKPQFRQEGDDRVRFPLEKWVCVRVHYQLSPTSGAIEVWQDGKQVLNANGPTLPFRSAIYNSLEVGISAHSDSGGQCTLYVDDLRVSSTPFSP